MDAEEQLVRFLAALRADVTAQLEELRRQSVDEMRSIERQIVRDLYGDRADPLLARIPTAWPEQPPLAPATPASTTS